MVPGGKPEVYRDFFQRIIDDSIDGFFVLDEKFRIVYCNESFGKLFRGAGLSSGDVSLLKISARNSKKPLLRKLEKVRKEGSSESVEMEVHPETGMRFCLISLNPMRSGGKSNGYIYGFVKDITEIKTLQHQLEIEKNYNRSIIETVNLGFVFVNDYNEYLDFNNEYLSITGKKKEDLEGKTFYDFTAPEYIEAQRRLMDEMKKTGRSFIYEKEFVRDDGSRVPVVVSVSRLVNSEGQSIGNFAFIRDISDQKNIERELKEQNKRFQALIDIYNTISARFLKCEGVDEVFQAIGESIDSMMKPGAMEILYRAGGGFKTISPQESLLRTPESIIDEKTSLMVRMLVSKKASIFLENLQTQLNDEDRQNFPGILKSNSAVFIPLTVKSEIVAIILLGFASSVYDFDTIVLNILMGISNLASITLEKIRSIDEQVLMKDALDRYERLTAMGRIIAGVAHEINNPLSIMQLDLDELKTMIEDGSAGEVSGSMELMHSLQEEISRISGIVKQLKDYANPASVSMDNVQVDDLLKNFPIKIYLKNLLKKGITINMKLGAGKANILIPRNRLIQVLMNLFSNADDSIEEKEHGLITIETGRVLRGVPMVYISVRDNGAGVAPENVQRIFEPFFTTKKSEGTGLGLSISYSIVKSYNGEITVSTSEAGGSEFIVYFPEKTAT
ncbi:MAG TPA: PAS domain S-box protein [Spirochaetota bacterium]|nr:PAS domain S-box protein [Spirochaetota bacterium]